MQKLFSRIGIIILCILVGFGCTQNLQKVQTFEKFDDDFHGILAKQYAEMANIRAEGYNWKYAEKFAQKAVDAQHKLLVLPEDPKDWKANNINLTEANILRQAIISQITHENIKNQAQALAELIYTYDYYLFHNYNSTDIDSMITSKNNLYSKIRAFQLIRIASYKIGKTIEIRFDKKAKLAHKQIALVSHKYDIAKKKFRNVILRSYSKVESPHPDKQIKHLKNQLNKLGINSKNIIVINFFDHNYKKHAVKVDFVIN
ncbi:hypothetical protein [Rickettsiales endosymbiont of Stachyamoeba lipophora]|uniref:hypothetical protein n=1 Tax=Rickettsiales endosymbiont of Stachyamoeba lipophora TaxID=2486578 RepID=UPI000F64721C|nr:hypothetical protein [Rickettsiales endosymbiont of Stachyamoeba lipophora]AZL16131.1 hypothetical protein EF513_06255 [Rickettsiales endosymbiont of Stachyamoeba lipophora]